MTVLRNDGSPQCRICFTGLEDGPLYQACRCRGTVGWIHENCLNTWINHTSSPMCELCGQNYNAPIHFRWWKFWNDPMFKLSTFRRHQFIIPVLINLVSNFIATEDITPFRYLLSVLIYAISFLAFAAVFTILRNLRRFAFVSCDGPYRSLRLEESLAIHSNQDDI